MPGAVPITSTYALTNATLPYVLALADNGVAQGDRGGPRVAPGVNVAAGKVTHAAVAEGTGMEFVPLDEAIGGVLMLSSWCSGLGARCSVLGY